MGTEDMLVVRFAASALRRWPVTAHLPPHVAVLRADRDDLAEICRYARLVIVRHPAGGSSMIGEETVLDDLDDAGRLFVNAWREQSPGKRRDGDGLSWDAPGFEPPDHPDG